jgi:hypothetical protein
MPEIQLTKPTIEHIPIDVRDRLNNLTDLGTAAPQFKLTKESDDSTVIDWTNADLTVPAGMTAYCLIDTTTLAKDRYELYLKFQLLPEVPVLGPFDVEVI